MGTRGSREEVDGTSKEVGKEFNVQTAPGVYFRISQKAAVQEMFFFCKSRLSLKKCRACSGSR